MENYLGENMYKLSEDYEEMREMFHDFAEGEVKPLAQKVDEEHMFPEETVAKMQELGFFGIPFDEEFMDKVFQIFWLTLLVKKMQQIL